MLSGENRDASGGRWGLVAKYLAHRLTSEREEEIARFELFLDAARSARLQPALRAWGDTLTRLLKQELKAAGAKHTQHDAEALLNLINGLTLQQISAPRPDFEKAVLLRAIRTFVERAAL